MKKLLLCLMTLMMCIGVFTLSASATTSSQDGLEITLTTDKESYSSSEEIIATLTVTNTNDLAVTNVSLEQVIPDGYVLAQDSEATKEISSISSGETETLVVTIVPDTSVTTATVTPTTDTTGTSSNATTGDDTNVNLMIAMMVLAVAGIVVLVVAKTKQGKKLLSILLCATMLGGIVSRDNSVKAIESEKTVTVETTVNVDNSDLTLNASVIYTLFETSSTTTSYTVVFDSNGGSETASQIVEEGQTAVVPMEPYKTGYTFSGWYSDVDLTEEYDFSSAVNADITLYALWVVETAPTDQDNDGVSDYMEELWGTDVTLDDTDGDGLSDYIEIYITETDPTIADSDGNGILDGNEDSDGDGLTNLEELTYGTEANKSDSDGDGLSDYDEINTYATDPINYDTDNDGASDGWEIAHGYDPLTYDDVFTISDEQSDDNLSVYVELDVSGKQTQTLVVEPYEDDTFINSTIPGYMGSAYDFSISGDIDYATITFTFNESLLNDETFNPVIYYYNEETQLLEELETTVKGNTATAITTHFSTYILLNKTAFDIVWENDIKMPDDESSNMTGIDVVFVIDSSGSMSSNDSKKLRLSAAKAFVDKLGENDRGAVIDFDSSASLYQSFTSDHDALYTAINKINSSGGTNLSKGMSLAISQFTSSSYTREDAYKYIIFLTDGDGSYSTSYTTQAAQNNIVVYTIGLGSGVKTSTLTAIAEGTGGKYYFASTASTLSDIYDDISVETIDYSTDSNNDGISDYYTKLLCEDSIILGTGTLNPFAGIDYDLIQANADYDGDGVINGDEIAIKSTSTRVYAFLSSDPTLTDTDYDGIDDDSDKKPMNNHFEAELKDTADGNDCDVEFTVDYRLFFNSNTSYQKNLSVLSILYAADIYSDRYVSLTSGASGGSDDATVLGSIFGLSDIEDIDIVSSDGTDEDDQTEIVIGHRLVEYKGETREIFILSVRGTNGTNAEWSSNFDIGANTSNYYDMTGEHPDWTNYDNHKGFDVAANRVMKAFNAYIEELENAGKLDTDAQKTILITGHSRGAAIANILGAQFEDNSEYDSFTYTFATPNSTTASNASSYKTIFNVINSDDLITYLPLEKWGFTNYGTIKSISVEEKYENKFLSASEGQFEWLMGFDYNNDGGTSRTLECFSKIVDNREKLYVMDTSSDGTVYESNVPHATRTNAYKELSTLAKTLKTEKLYKFCDLEVVYDSLFFFVAVNYCPAYFLQILANMTTSVGPTLGRDVKGKYATAKASFVASSGKVVLGGMTHPHMPQTYYLIAHNNFKDL